MKKIKLLSLICLTAALLGLIPGGPVWAFGGDDGGQDDGGDDDDGENDDDEGEHHDGQGHHWGGHHGHDGFGRGLGWGYGRFVFTFTPLPLAAGIVIALIGEAFRRGVELRDDVEGLV